jgi:hypothetical protein
VIVVRLEFRPDAASASLALASRQRRIRKVYYQYLTPWPTRVREVDGKLYSEQVGISKAKKWLERYEAAPMGKALDDALLAYIAHRESEIPLTAS